MKKLSVEKIQSVANVFIAFQKWLWSVTPTIITQKQDKFANKLNEFRVDFAKVIKVMNERLKSDWFGPDKQLTSEDKSSIEIEAPIPKIVIDRDEIKMSIGVYADMLKHPEVFIIN